MNYYDIGKIVNTHGIRGEVRVMATTDFPEERFRPGNVVYLFEKGAKQPLELEIKSHRKHKNFDLLVFKGYENINLIEKYKGSDLKVTEDQQEELEEGSYYYREIIGLDVIDQTGEVIGQVSEIMETGANDVWVVKRRGKKELLLPVIPDVIQEVDIPNNKLIVEVPEGLDD
ncbi:ribosome maturation factor RimM [Ligilactobacillus ceti]|uniref:Ribosome maturation factor RimM n=1 Tax=Ligilactobacillus ceti DSM 22408 TaxID=1122146 RepID=A0A0R2KR61_9LACO|nr:ribosome maturation factor RimM [Ligilactobacillus ceti]KRN88612.1 16S rRNA processing protein RimM [Ligilactobacillus ceti DSM 22408]